MKIICYLITLVIVLNSVVFAGDYSSYLQELKGDVQQYKTQSSVDSVKDVAPQYDEDKANYLDSQDSDTASEFLHYGSTISNSCTVTINEITKTAHCEDKIEYEYYATPVSQNKILININYEAEDFINDKIVYYCSENDVIYGTNSECSANCTYQTCDPTYYLSGNQCYSAPQCSVGYTYINSLNKCRKYIPRYSCSLGGNYNTLNQCNSNCSTTTPANSVISGCTKKMMPRQTMYRGGGGVM